MELCGQFVSATELQNILVPDAASAMVSFHHYIFAFSERLLKEALCPEMCARCFVF